MGLLKRIKRSVHDHANWKKFRQRQQTILPSLLQANENQIQEAINSSPNQVELKLTSRASSQSLSNSERSKNSPPRIGSGLVRHQVAFDDNQNQPSDHFDTEQSLIGLQENRKDNRHI